MPVRGAGFPSVVAGFSISRYQCNQLAEKARLSNDLLCVRWDAILFLSLSVSRLAAMSIDRQTDKWTAVVACHRQPLST